MKIKSSLIVEPLEDGGCLIVDGDSKKSHSLTPEAATVWTCLEAGVFDREQIASKSSLGLDIVDRAFAAFAEAELLETASASSRREIFSRAAAIAGVAAGLELIETVATPTPAAAQSIFDGTTG